jgi:threonylcarbamoyladenosine tRNA methylthiotransferase MtaB
MNRKYTVEEFEEIVKRIRNTYSDSILTTDIIVGFPGETEEEFEKTYEFLKKIKFYKMHIFKYSVRKGTKAEKLENQQSPEIKEKRSNILLELSDKNENEYLNRYLNKELEVLFEEKSGEYYKGHTANYLMVKVKSDENLSGKIKKVKPLEVEDLEIVGEIID